MARARVFMMAVLAAALTFSLGMAGQVTWWGDPIKGVTSGLFTGAISVDGDLGDWGITIPDTYDAQNTFTNDPNQTAFVANPSLWKPQQNGVSYWVEDSTNWHNRGSASVGPGYGGQNFDMEAAYAAWKGNTLYLAFVRGSTRTGRATGAMETPGSPPETCLWTSIRKGSSLPRTGSGIWPSPCAPATA